VQRERGGWGLASIGDQTSQAGTSGGKQGKRGGELKRLEDRSYGGRRRVRDWGGVTWSDQFGGWREEGMGGYDRGGEDARSSRRGGRASQSGTKDEKK